MATGSVIGTFTQGGASSPYTNSINLVAGRLYLAFIDTFKSGAVDTVTYVKHASGGKNVIWTGGPAAVKYGANLTSNAAAMTSWYYLAEHTETVSLQASFSGTLDIQVHVVEVNGVSQSAPIGNSATSGDSTASRKTLTVTNTTRTGNITVAASGWHYSSATFLESFTSLTETQQSTELMVSEVGGGARTTVTVDNPLNEPTYNALIVVEVVAAANASAAITLDDDTLAATAKAPASATLTASLDPDTLSSTAKVKVQAALAVTLDADTLLSTATDRTNASASIVLDDDTLSSTGVARTTASLEVTLDPDTLSSTAKVKVQAALAVTLDADTLLSTAGQRPSAVSSAQIPLPLLTGKKPLPRDIYVDRVHDSLALRAADLAMTGFDTDGVVQAVYQKLTEFLGEWFLNDAAGFPWFEIVLVHTPNLPLIRQEMRDQIEAVEGVVGVTSLNLDLNRVDRTLSVTFTANTIYGVLANQTLQFNPTELTS